MDTDRDEEELGNGRDASGDQGWRLEDDRAYWRRRFFVLCFGAAALGVCAFLFPGAHQPSARASAAARAAVAASAKRQALPSVAYGSAWSPPAPTASPSPAVSLSASPAVPAPAASAAAAAPKTKTTAKAGTSPAATVSTTGGAAGGAVADAACAPASIVLSLFTSRASYAPGQWPAFNVYAVSTAAAACTLTYGAGSVQVVVTRAGHVVWDSAACDPPPAKTVRFTLAVPQVLTMTWNPKVKTPAGCGGSLTAARAAGTFDAVAMSHGQSSAVRAFRLTRLPLTRGRRPSAPRARLRPR